MIARVLYYSATKDDASHSNAQAYNVANKNDPREQVIQRVSIETYHNMYKTYPKGVTRCPALLQRVFDPNDPYRRKFTDKLFIQSDSLSIAHLIDKLFTPQKSKFQIDYEKMYKDRTKVSNMQQEGMPGNNPMIQNRNNVAPRMNQDDGIQRAMGKIGMAVAGDPGIIDGIDKDIRNDISKSYSRGKNGELLGLNPRK